MANLFFSFAQTGFWVLLIAAALTLATPFLRGRYRAGALRWVWLVLALRLLLPANLPALAPVRVEVPVPAAMTEPAVKAPQTLSGAGGADAQDVTGAQPPESAGAAPLTRLFPAASPVQLAAAVWLAVAAALFAAELIRCGIWQRRAMRWNRPVPPGAAQMAAEAAARVGLARVPRVWENGAVAVPMAMGVLRPALLVPPELLKAEKREQLRMVLLHELTHCRRRDTLCRFAVLLARCLHWYNPGVWIIERQFERAAELACDEAVLSLSVSRRAYADALMSAVKSSAGRPALTTCFASDKRFLRSRFAAIFSCAGKRRGTALVALLCAAAACTALVACAPVPAAGESSAPPAFSSPESASDPSGNPGETEAFSTSMDGVYTTRKIYAYTRVENPEDGGVFDSEAGTYTGVGLPELEGRIGIPLCGGLLDGTGKIRLCTVAGSGEAVFYASDDGGATYAEKRSSVTLPNGGSAQVIEMQNVTDELCLLLAVDVSQRNFWLLRCGSDENGLPVLDGAQALPTPVSKQEGIIRMSFVNGEVGYLIDIGDTGDKHAMPCVWRTADGGATWTQLDFADVLADCPFGGYNACCIFTVGSRTEIRCFTTPDHTVETIALVSDDFGQTWDWYPRVPNPGTDRLIEEDKAAGIETLLPELYPEDDGGEEYARIREFIESDGQPSELYFRF